MFLKLIFLEGKSRRSLFEKYPPVRVWVSSSRIRCVPNGDFSSKESSVGCYAWFVWKRGITEKPPYVGLTRRLRLPSCDTFFLRN